MHGFRAISAALSRWEGSIGDFVKQLDEDGIRYLSYSRLRTVESCEYRYLLEYVEGVKVEEPLYFTKAKVFHDAAATAYQQLGRDNLAHGLIEGLAESHLAEQDTTHLANAIQVLVENAHQGYEVVATEQPFVLSLGEGIPPLIGIIDLLLRKADAFMVVDHKTGRNFHDQDELQLVLYREFIRREHKPKRCLAAFDEYRWVNDLGRIRKPAFRRTAVKFGRWSWHSALRRTEEAYRTIRSIEGTGEASSQDECWMCPLKDVCPKVGIGRSEWW